MNDQLKKGKGKLDMKEVDQMFDSMEAEENRGTFSIVFTSANNLIMIVVIAFSGMVL